MLYSATVSNAIEFILSMSDKTVLEYAGTVGPKFNPYFSKYNIDEVFPTKK